MVADQFVEACSLPTWGPFGIGNDLNLLSNIEGKVLLEIGCGSGRSIKYLINHGAKKVYGLDMSKVQIAEASRFNTDLIESGKVKLINGKMELKLDIEFVDIVFSIYGIGWTYDPEATLKNIYSYLKPGGLFIWSWDHGIFSNIRYENDKYVISHSYHDEKPRLIRNWKKDGTQVYIAYRKTSTWFTLLRNAGFEVIGYHEPKPNNLNHGFKDPGKYYSIEKAEKMPASFIFVCKK